MRTCFTLEESSVDSNALSWATTLKFLEYKESDLSLGQMLDNLTNGNKMDDDVTKFKAAPTEQQGFNPSYVPLK